MNLADLAAIARDGDLVDALAERAHTPSSVPDAHGGRPVAAGATAPTSGVELLLARWAAQVDDGVAALQEAARREPVLVGPSEQGQRSGSAHHASAARARSSPPSTPAIVTVGRGGAYRSSRRNGGRRVGVPASRSSRASRLRTGASAATAVLALSLSGVAAAAVGRHLQPMAGLSLTPSAAKTAVFAGDVPRVEATDAPSVSSATPRSGASTAAGSPGSLAPATQGTSAVGGQPTEIPVTDGAARTTTPQRSAESATGARLPLPLPVALSGPGVPVLYHSPGAAGRAPAATTQPPASQATAPSRGTTVPSPRPGSSAATKTHPGSSSSVATSTTRASSSSSATAPTRPSSSSSSATSTTRPSSSPPSSSPTHPRPAHSSAEVSPVTPPPPAGGNDSVGKGLSGNGGSMSSPASPHATAPARSR